MGKTRNLSISNVLGDSLVVPLSPDGDREAGLLVIDGILYHIERLAPECLVSEYRVDGDPEYRPHTDDSGRCVMIAPFSE